MSKRVLAKCTNCGIEKIRMKGNSGLGHTIRGQYCGSMRVIRWMKE